MNNLWFIIDNVAEIDTPVLVVYPHRVKHNIETAITMIDDVERLRPHVKTNKSPQVTTMMLQAGITKFKCATIAEAEMLGMCGAPDVLLAYQPNLPKLNRFIRLKNKYPGSRFSCLTDNVETAALISHRAVESATEIAIFLDLNVGMNRTGISPGNEALALYQACTKLPGIKVIGLHAYNGHVHEADIKVRMEKVDQSMEPVHHLSRLIEEAGLPVPVIIAGGAPTYPILAGDKRLECSPGTFAYWDRGYQLAYDEQAFQPAALVLARVISLPDERTICIDVGHKSVSAENEIAKRIYFLNAPELVFKGQSEEHLIADAGEGHLYRVGDVLYGLPYHICPSIALYERVLVVENQIITGEWLNIARDRKITI